MLDRRSLIALAPLALSLGLTACGDDDHDDATFRGNVTAVAAETAVTPAGPRSTFFASLGRLLVPEATAQGACPATTVLACASRVVPGGATETDCDRVDPDDCTFGIRVDIDVELQTVDLFFLDVDPSLDRSSSVSRADLTNPIARQCRNNDTILRNVQIDFGTNTATAAAVQPDEDNCDDPSTPYSYAAATPLRRTPSGALAWIFALGIVALGIPRRRGRDR